METIQPNLKPNIKSSLNVSTQNVIPERIICCSKIAVDCSKIAFYKLILKLPIHNGNTYIANPPGISQAAFIKKFKSNCVIVKFIT